MEVRLFPNLRRPGVGLKPRRESQRPLLPQHARNCPVLEAGSALGFLIYPPLEPYESFYIGYEGEGRYRFGYYVKPHGGKWEAIFSLAVVFPVGGTGKLREDVTFMPGAPAMSRELALHIAQSLFAQGDLGTPAGAVTLRGAWNFQTQPGWDSVYTPIFNAIERPVAPMLVVRVETDWYAHESEFRYVLQPGEGMSVAHSMPIGQVFFVPREQITLRDCSEEELAGIRRSQEEFSREKVSAEVTTPYGVPYSPHYLRQSRLQNASAGQRASEGTTRLEPDHQRVPAQELRPPTLQRFEMDVVPVPRDPSTWKVGRNEPCPCGSGKKYKKCHGETS
jgi:SEC-C motif